MRDQRRIVVRGEHTREAAEALRWAVHEARRYDAVVAVVQPFDAARRADLALERDLARARRDARYRAQSWVVDVVADLPPGVPVTVATPEGPVEQCLTAAAADSDALVLGATDPQLALLLEGACRCPVVAVSADGTAAGADELLADAR